MFSLLRRLRRDTSGATMIEYGLIAALVSVAAIAALGTVGDSVLDTFTSIETNLNASAPTVGP